MARRKGVKTTPSFHGWAPHAFKRAATFAVAVATFCVLDFEVPNVAGRERVFSVGIGRPALANPFALVQPGVLAHHSLHHYPVHRPVHHPVHHPVHRAPAVVAPIRPAPAVQPWYWGRIVAGATVGAIVTAGAVGVAPAAPSPELCWYWTDSSRTHGYWDYCVAPSQ